MNRFIQSCPSIPPPTVTNVFLLFSICRLAKFSLTLSSPPHFLKLHGIFFPLLLQRSLFSFNFYEFSLLTVLKFKLLAAWPWPLSRIPQILPPYNTLYYHQTVPVSLTGLIYQTFIESAKNKGLVGKTRKKKRKERGRKRGRRERMRQRTDTRAGIPISSSVDMSKYSCFFPNGLSIQHLVDTPLTAVGKGVDERIPEIWP